jgi:hypothetical protein
VPPRFMGCSQRATQSEKNVRRLSCMFCHTSHHSQFARMTSTSELRDRPSAPSPLPACDQRHALHQPHQSVTRASQVPP